LAGGLWRYLVSNTTANLPQVINTNLLRVYAKLNKFSNRTLYVLVRLHANNACSEWNTKLDRLTNVPSDGIVGIGFRDLTMYCRVSGVIARS